MQEILSNIVTVALLVFLWSVSGILLMGFVYGPFHHLGNTGIRWRCFFSGFLGPVVCLAVVANLYADDWGPHPKKLYWKSVV